MCLGWEQTWWSRKKVPQKMLQEVLQFPPETSSHLTQCFSFGPLSSCLLYFPFVSHNNFTTLLCAGRLPRWLYALGGSHHNCMLYWHLHLTGEEARAQASQALCLQPRFRMCAVSKQSHGFSSTPQCCQLDPRLWASCACLIHSCYLQSPELVGLQSFVHLSIRKNFYWAQIKCQDLRPVVIKCLRNERGEREKRGKISKGGS